MGNVDWHLKRGLPDHSLRESMLSVNSGFLVYEAGCQGLGIITMMEEFEYLENSNLVHVLPHEQGPSFEVFYITRSDVVPTQLQKRFLEILSD